MKRIYPVFGLVASLSYVLAVIIGGFMVPGYSHLYNSISELTASNVPRIPIIFILFSIYNISLTVFGVGLYSHSAFTPSMKTKIASVMIIVVGVLGIAMLYYVQDPRNVMMSANGKIHLILAIISSILTMVIILLVGLSFRNGHKGLTLYSFISLLILMITGGIAGVSTANNSALGGLYERFTIGTFIQWVLIISICIGKDNKLISQLSQSEIGK
jgi:hypothetical protein